MILLLAVDGCREPTSLNPDRPKDAVQGLALTSIVRPPTKADLFVAEGKIDLYSDPDSSHSRTGSSAWQHDQFGGSTNSYMYRLYHSKEISTCLQASRHDHSTAVVDNQLYLWGGYQDGMPEVHDSSEKRQFFSSVEMFDVNTGCWEQRITRGTPPLGVMGHSCVAVKNELHYFGGRCGHGYDCYHNSVHTLSTSTLQWRMLAPSTTESGAPIQKHHCGIVHFTVGEEDLLYVVGGEGHPAPSLPQHGTQYQPAGYGGVCTNEQHIFSLSTSE